MSPTLNAHGVSVSPPAGFEGRVFRRPAQGEVSATGVAGSGLAATGVVAAPAPAGEIPNTVVHVSTIALPPDTGDFASSAVEFLGQDDVLVVLFEYAAESVGQPLFARQGLPRALAGDDFSPGVLQRMIKGQAGCQTFFTENGRPFCLYVVIGSYARRGVLVNKVNSVLSTLQIDARASASSSGAPASPGPVAPTPPPTTMFPPATTPTTAGPATTTTSTPPRPGPGSTP